MSERDLILDFTDRELEQEHRLNSESQNQPPSHPSINPAQLPRQDLIDTYNLSRNYLDHTIVDLKSDLLSEQDSFSKKFRDESSMKFKSGGNCIQFKFNEGIQSGFQQIYKQLATPNTTSASLALNIISKHKDRNKLIRIVDTSAGGWATVRVYGSSDIAENEEDDKKIRQADNRALKSIKEKTKVRPPPYTRPTPRTDRSESCLGYYLYTSDTTLSYRYRT
jgi:hypothetical protein